MSEENTQQFAMAFPFNVTEKHKKENVHELYVIAQNMELQKKTSELTLKIAELEQKIEDYEDEIESFDSRKTSLTGTISNLKVQTEQYQKIMKHNETVFKNDEDLYKKFQKLFMQMLFMAAAFLLLSIMQHFMGGLKMWFTRLLVLGALGLFCKVTHDAYFLMKKMAKALDIRRVDPQVQTCLIEIKRCAIGLERIDELN
jgi:hypothetical protein